MKKLYTISLLAICGIAGLHPFGANAQSPAWQWAKSAWGASWDYANSVATDASGNVFVAGSFMSPSITFGTTTLANAYSGYYDMFLAKYDASGNVLWAKGAGGSSWDEGLSCSTDASGNIIVTGYFNTSITFGTTVLTNTGGGTDIFIVKYDPSGNVLWAKSAGGTSGDVGYSCSTDAGGNIIATGYFASSSITFGTTVLTNAGFSDMFIVKYDPSGNVLWAKSAGGTSYDLGYSCSTDAGGNIIATGYFQSSSITFGTTVLTNAGGYDIFIVKYDPSGNVLWAKSAGGTDNDYGMSCSTDASGNIIATGYFQSSSITFGTTVLTSAGGYDIFIVKYDASGNVLWAKSAGGTSDDWGRSCSTDAAGNIIATGYFKSSSITFGTTVLTNADNTGNTYDMFIVKYDASGNVLWAKSAGGTNHDQGMSVATDASGNVFVTGFFSGSTITFGATVLTGANDIFLAKLDNVTGISENNPPQADGGYFIYPNPTSGNLRITNLYEFTNYELKIYNVLGEKVYEVISPPSSVAIDLTNQPAGMYFVNVNEGYAVYKQKIIIRK